MALPQNRPSTRPQPGDFVEPKDRPYDPLSSASKGGAQINVPGNRMTHTWVCVVRTDDAGNNPGIWIAYEDDGGGPATRIIAGSNLTTPSLAFDANMQPTVAYTDPDGCKFRWYDSLASATVTTTVAGATSIQCALDDPRPEMAARSDVIVAYTRAGKLYYRQQRDRYTIERLIGNAPVGKLTKVGLNRGFRLQFEVDPRL